MFVDALRKVDGQESSDYVVEAAVNGLGEVISSSKFRSLYDAMIIPDISSLSGLLQRKFNSFRVEELYFLPPATI